MQSNRFISHVFSSEHYQKRQNNEINKYLTPSACDLSNCIIVFRHRPVYKTKLILGWNVTNFTTLYYNIKVFNILKHHTNCTSTVKLILIGARGQIEGDFYAPGKTEGGLFSLKSWYRSVSAIFTILHGCHFYCG